MGLPEWVADAFGEYMTAFSEGYGDFTTPDVVKVTGNAPALTRRLPVTSPRCSVEQFARLPNSPP